MEREWLRELADRSTTPVEGEGAGELAKKRAEEAREITVVLGMLRLDGSVTRDFAERKLEIALDRIHRIQEGEDYIERWEDLNRRTNGAAHFTPPHPDALPVDVHGPNGEKD